MEKPADFYESAVAFGNFQRLLADFPAETLHETIEGFHDTRARFAVFEQAVKEDVMGERNILGQDSRQDTTAGSGGENGKPLAVVRAEAEEVCRRQSGTAGAGHRYRGIEGKRNVIYLRDQESVSFQGSHSPRLSIYGYSPGI
mgnify:CR=1 FL=1